MRKVSNILAWIITALFLIHAVIGSIMLLRLGEFSLKPLHWLLFWAVAAHGVLGIAATVGAVKSGKESGKWYLKQNAAYWTKRFSGMAILILMCLHIGAYSTVIDGVFTLKEFTFGRMAAQMLLIIAVFIHLGVSVKSMLIARGVIKFKRRTVDIMAVMSLMTLIFAVATAAYFIQWNV